MQYITAKDVTFLWHFVKLQISAPSGFPRGCGADITPLAEGASPKSCPIECCCRAIVSMPAHAIHRKDMTLLNRT